MIKDIIDLLNADDFLVGDPDIDFAKGANKLPGSLKQVKQLIKRNRHGRS